MSRTHLRATAVALACGLMSAASAHAATVYTGDVIQGTRVMQILHYSPDPKCDGDGCGEGSADYVE